MHWKKMAFLFLMIMMAVGLSGGLAIGENINADSWAPVEQALGAHGEVSPDGVISFDLPRNLTVTVDGIRLAPGSDLSHEIRMMKAGNKTLVVGEIILKEGEVKSVTQKLLQAGLEETALHNHLLRVTPHLVYLHIHGYETQYISPGRSVKLPLRWKAARRHQRISSSKAGASTLRNWMRP